MAAVDNVRTARDNLAQILATQTTAWILAGRPPTFSIDGESYQWNDWVSAMNKDIADLTALLPKVSSPFLIRSRGRA